VTEMHNKYGNKMQLKTNITKHHPKSYTNKRLMKILYQSKVMIERCEEQNSLQK